MPVVPITEDDLVQGALKFLKTKTDLLSVLSVTASNVPYLFQDTIMVNMDKGLSNAVVVADGGSWAAPNLHNTARFRRIKIEIWAGAELSTDGSVKSPQETRRRVESIFKIIDKHLFRPYNKVVMWGTIKTILSDRTGDLQIYSIDDAEATLKGEVFYGVQF